MGAAARSYTSACSDSAPNDWSYVNTCGGLSRSAGSARRTSPRAASAVAATPRPSASSRLLGGRMRTTTRTRSAMLGGWNESTAS